MIPIGIQTLNKPQLLIRTLKSLEKSGLFEQCSDIHVFDCGSDEEYLEQIEYYCSIYDITLHKTDERLLIHHGVLKMESFFGRDFIRIEDDIIVSKNWYSYATEVMSTLENWNVINFYNTDNRMLENTNIETVKRKGWKLHWGICLTAFKFGIIERINTCGEKNLRPFDVAMSYEFGWYPDGVYKRGTGDGTLCVHFPSLAQHLGAEFSQEGAVEHFSTTYKGEEFNALSLLK